MRKVILGVMCLLMVLSIAGCRSTSTAKKELKQETKTIFILSKNATQIGLVDYKDKVAELKENIEKSVLVLLRDSDVEITIAVEESLLNYIPEEYKEYIKDAFEILDLYYESPTADEILDKANVARLKAFFEGIVAGCDLILKENEPE